MRWARPVQIMVALVSAAACAPTAFARCATTCAGEAVSGRGEGPASEPPTRANSHGGCTASARARVGAMRLQETQTDNECPQRPQEASSHERALSSALQCQCPRGGDTRHHRGRPRLANNTLKTRNRQECVTTMRAHANGFGVAYPTLARFKGIWRSPVDLGYPVVSIHQLHFRVRPPCTVCVYVRPTPARRFPQPPPAGPSCTRHQAACLPPQLQPPFRPAHTRTHPRHTPHRTALISSRW